MGTTMTAVVVAGGRQLLDRPRRRLARVPRCTTATLRRITDDHSLVEELVREGRLTPEQAESHPRRAIVTRALGVDADVEVDLYTLDVDGRRPRPALLRRAHHDGARARHRAARCAASPTRSARPSCSSTPRTAPAARTTRASSSIDVLEVDAVDAPDPELLGDAARSPRRPVPRADATGARARRRTARAAPRVVGPPRSAARCCCSCRSSSCSAIAVGGVGWYARRSYFVGFARDNRGRDLQGRARRRARLESDGRAAHRAHRARSSRRSTATAWPAAAARGSLDDAQRFVARPAGRRRRDLHDHDHDHDHDRPKPDATKPRPRRRTPRHRDDRGPDHGPRRRSPASAAAPSSRSGCSS